MTETHQCAWCRRYFETERMNVLYYSDDCRRLAHNERCRRSYAENPRKRQLRRERHLRNHPEVLTCRRCGNEFRKGSGRWVYCSEVCAKAAQTDMKHGKPVSRAGGRVG